MGPEVAHFLKVKWALMEWVEFSHPEHTGMIQFNSVQSLSHVQLCYTMDYSTPGLPYPSPPSNAEYAPEIRAFLSSKQLHARVAGNCQGESLQVPWREMSSSSCWRPRKGLLSARVNLPWTWTSIWLTKIVNNANLCTQTQWGQTKWNRKKKKKSLLQSQARRMSGLCSKSSDCMMVCGRCYRQNMGWSFRECGFILISVARFLCSGWHCHPLLV